MTCRLAKATPSCSCRGALHNLPHRRLFGTAAALHRPTPLSLEAMAASGLGFFDAAPASSSDEEDGEAEEAAPAPAPAPTPAPAPVPPPPPVAAPEGDAGGAKRKRTLPTPEEAAALVSGPASYVYTGDADEPSGFYSGGAAADAAAKLAAAAHVGIEASRTTEVPDSTVGFLLAGGGKQIKALEDATGCRVVVDREGRGGREAARHTSADQAQPVRKVTLIGDEAALREGERRLQEIVLASGKNIQRTIRCTANQAGALIGRGGTVIKRLQSATNTLINVSGRDAASSDPDAPRTVSITGSAWAVDLASRFVFAAMRDPNELGALIADAEAAQAAGAGSSAKAAHAGSGYGDAAAYVAAYGGGR